MVSSALPGPFRCWGHRAFDGLIPQLPRHEPEQKGKEQHIWGWTSRGLARLCLLCAWKLSGTEGGNMDEEQIGEGMEHHIQELGLHLKCNTSHCTLSGQLTSPTKPPWAYPSPHWSLCSRHTTSVSPFYLKAHPHSVPHLAPFLSFPEHSSLRDIILQGEFCLISLPYQQAAPCSWPCGFGH